MMRRWVDGLKDIPIEGCSGGIDHSLCTMCTARGGLGDFPQGTRICVPKRHCREVATLGEKMRSRIRQQKGNVR